MFIPILTGLLATGGGPKIFDPTSPPGTPYAGGYYAGQINDGGVIYNLIISPRASGYNGTIIRKNATTADPTACQTLTNGLAATQAMAALGATVYPAASFCTGLSIGGYTDWYLAARDEWEIMYRAFKPDSTSNVTLVKTAGGFGSDGTGSGANANSVPTHPANTTTNPTTTTAGTTWTAVTTTSERLTALPYITSSTFTTGKYWQSTTYGGQQSMTNTITGSAVRAIRRVRADALIV
jgi:hypothetical protein